MTKTNKNILYSLKTKIICIIVISSVMSYGIYKLVLGWGYNIVTEKYMTENAITSRIRSYTAEFQSYVRKNNVSSKDLSLIAEWTMEKKYVHILVFQNKSPQIEAGSWGAYNLSGTEYEQYYKAMSDSYSFTSIDFSNGTFNVSLDEYTYEKYFGIADTVSLMVAFGFLLKVILVYLSHMSIRIKKLSAAVQKIENGNLDISIPSNGNDEISVLASGMDSMRVSVKSQIQSEHEARQANVDLITAMSHDIRTPLTTLIGYLELMQSKSYIDEDQLDNYLNIAYEKSMRLKELTDELFRYFLVFSNSEISVNIEEFDAEILFDQLFGEEIIVLRDNGIRVIEYRHENKCIINTDAICLKRVIDNVFSNIRKHGDQTKPVIIMIQPENDNMLHVTITNSVPAIPNKVESTRIGLKTCEKLMKVSGGEFRTVTEDLKFVSELIIPIKEK